MGQVEAVNNGPLGLVLRTWVLIQSASFFGLQNVGPHSTLARRRVRDVLRDGT